MASLEAVLIRSNGELVTQLWNHPLEVNRELTIAQVAGLDDGRGGKVDLGVHVAGIPESEFKNVSGRGYHALIRWDGRHLHVSRRMIPKPTMNGFLDAKGKPMGNELRLLPGESFRIARFHFTIHDEPPEFSMEFEESTDLHEPHDWNQSIAPEQVKALRKTFAPDEMAVTADKVLETKLVDSDKVINGLLDIVDRFDASRGVEKLNELFRQAVRMAVPIEDARADVILVPPVGKGDPTPLGTERLAYFSRKFVRDAILKFQTTGGVLAGLWRPDLQSVAGASRVGGTSLGNAVSGTHAALNAPGWAVCAPVPARGHTADRLALYVSAPVPDPMRPMDLASDMGVAQAQKVVLLYAKLYAALEHMNRMDAVYREAMSYLPKPVRTLLKRPDYDEKLAPRTINVTVLFCDLRGSCTVADRGSQDLRKQWDTVFQEALEHMSRAIDENGGVIGGIIGDAVMGFWGWPDNLSSEEQVRRAARAALSIRQNFDRWRQRNRSQLTELRFGIGLTHGLALVGKLGNYDMKKIDVFGPTVNRAARLESLTKRFGVEIIVDETAAQHLGEGDWSLGRTRRLAQISPAGFEEPFGAFELATDDDDPMGRMDDVFANYAEALAEFEDGRNWNRATSLLEAFADRDGPSAFLKKLIANRASAPSDWLRSTDRRCYIKLDKYGG
jgi:adenylate cyclase